MSRSLIVVLLLAILMAVTNPTTGDFKDFVQAQVMTQANSAGVVPATAAGWFAGNAAVMAVERRDYVVASVYLIRMGGKTYPWIGVFKNFIALRPHS